MGLVLAAVLGLQVFGLLYVRALAHGLRDQLLDAIEHAAGGPTGCARDESGDGRLDEVAPGD